MKVGLPITTTYELGGRCPSLPLLDQELMPLHMSRLTDTRESAGIEAKLPGEWANKSSSCIYRGIVYNGVYGKVVLYKDIGKRRRFSSFHLLVLGGILALLFTTILRHSSFINLGPRLLQLDIRL
jgi:hypothetical protein